MQIQGKQELDHKTAAENTLSVIITHSNPIIMHDYSSNTHNTHHSNNLSKSLIIPLTLSIMGTL